MRGHTAIFGGYLSCLLIFLFRKSQWSEIVQGTGRLMAKTVLADEINMFPAQWCNMWKIFFRNRFTPLFQFLNSLGKIDCIPGCNRRHNQMQAGSSMHLVFKGSIPEFPMFAGEELARQCMKRFSL